MSTIFPYTIEEGAKRERERTEKRKKDKKCTLLSNNVVHVYKYITDPHQKHIDIWEMYSAV
jgi:hypothetical protein